jgi:LysR family glycine cleavage system transcriptional activator
MVRLSPEQLFAVCSPKLLTGRSRLTKPSDVLKFPLIYLMTARTGRIGLRQLVSSAPSCRTGQFSTGASMVIDAAIDGQGIALARTTLAATDLISGRLVRPFAEELRLAKTYWIVCPKVMSGVPKIVAFRDWLLAEAASDMRQLKKLGTRARGSRRPTA